MKQRTNTQNNALHKYFEELALELNNAGFDMKRTLKPEIDIPWSKEAVKTHLWKPVMKAQLGKESTTELTSKEVCLVFETLNRHLSTKLGLSVQFPSIESLITTQNNE